MHAYRDRVDAGRQVAEHLMDYADNPKVLVLGLPRGGVVVAAEVAQALHVQMDCFVVRKLGVPGYAELAMGAVAGDGTRVLNDDVVRGFDISDAEIESVARQEQEEIRRREEEYRDERPEPAIRGRIVILVDDGLATGASMRAAVLAVRKQNPEKIVVAVPAGARETCRELGRIANEVVCVLTPEPFYGVGAWYRDFSQTTDAQVREVLRRVNEEVAARRGTEE
jgi:putative phosphoribosyl transferase